MSDRTATVARNTLETQIKIDLNLDRAQTAEISTGLGFLDHMLSALSKHGRIGLKLDCKGDLHIDDHHTVEDCAIALGEALERALGEKRGITRFGYAYAPLDEALARVVIDLSGRPGAFVTLPFSRETIAGVATENIVHFFQSFAVAARMTLHVDLIRGDNDHHRAEAAFKALALALRQAIAMSGEDQIPGTKGVL